METLPGADDGRIYLPIGVDRYRWTRTPSGPLFSHAQVRAPAVRGDTLVIDMRISTPDGATVAVLEGLRCRRASRDVFRQRVDAQVAEMLYAWCGKPGRSRLLPTPCVRNPRRGPARGPASG